MARRYTRIEFLARLQNEIASGCALLMTGAGNGLCAKFIERGGADIIGIYNTGYFRMQGYGSLAGMLPVISALMPWLSGLTRHCAASRARSFWSENALTPMPMPP